MYGDDLSMTNLLQFGVHRVLLMEPMPLKVATNLPTWLGWLPGFQFVMQDASPEFSHRFWLHDALELIHLGHHTKGNLEQRTHNNDIGSC